MADDLLGALKDLFNNTPALVAAAPGGLHTNEGAVVSVFPYVTLRQFSASVGLQTSTTIIDEVRVRVRCWGTKLEDARALAKILDDTFLNAGGLTWTGGWTTPLRRVDQSENKSAGRAPGNAGLLRSFDQVYLARCGRSAPNA